MTPVLFWDVDGTLLTTARAGIFAWEAAAREVIGKPADFSSLETAGLTDTEIAMTILKMARVDPIEPRVHLLLREYERNLPECLHRRVGAVLPGVRAVLEDLAKRPSVLSMLLTGNTRVGASAKLKHYGLSRYFSTGAFAEDGASRASIARFALSLAQKVLEEPISLEDVYVIGDTPSDILSGKEIGARTLAVATGVYSREKLLGYAPSIALSCLPDPERFADLVGL